MTKTTAAPEDQVRRLLKTAGTPSAPAPGITLRTPPQPLFQLLAPGSMVLTRTNGPVNLRHINLWWTWTPGASWRHPAGPHSSVANRADHPVVQVAYEDAAAYATWAG